MTNEVNFRIEIVVDEVDDKVIANSQWLSDLSAELQRELEIPCQVEKIRSPEDTQAGDIVIAVGILNLSIAALGIMWSIIKMRRCGSITLEKTLKDGTKIVLAKGNLTDDELKKYEERILQDVEAKQLRDFIIRVGN
jgi:hypothetical protein